MCAVGRAQRFQGDRDGIAVDFEVTGGLKDLLNELAAFVFTAAVVRADGTEERRLDSIRVRNSSALHPPRSKMKVTVLEPRRSRTESRTRENARFRNGLPSVVMKKKGSPLGGALSQMRLSSLSRPEKLPPSV